MRKSLGIIFLLAGLIVGISSIFPIQWLWQNRWQRVEGIYFSDLKTFFSSPNGMSLKKELKDFEFFFPDPQVLREIEDVHFPVATSDQGRILLRIEIFRWIHEGRYGYVFQHEFFDLQSGEEEKVYEWSKTYEAGIFF